ncbi:hypothetical protein EON76_04665 [bacterium]|nr:MAG: hypothetical protein EON76_04665 [bacterium]
MESLEQRVTGTEMEYSIWARRSPDARLEPLANNSSLQTILKTCLPNEIKTAGESGMTSNGSRIYVDLGRFIEYATPEDISFEGTVANEIAGERIVVSTMDNAVAEGFVHDFAVNKRVVSDDNNTLGYHTSFMVDGSKFDMSLSNLKAIGMHLATQNIYAGAGALHYDHHYKVKGYAIAQKVLNLNCEIARSTHATEQPLLSERDVARANNGTKRLHLTTMDANISPWATWMRLGTTSIVARLIENDYQGRYAKDLDLLDMPMHRYAKYIALDPTLKFSVRSRHRDKRMRGIDVQRILFEHALKLDLPAQEQKVMAEWNRALDDLETDPKLLADRADWVIRKKVIDHALAKRGLDLKSKVAISRDKAYDYLDNKPTADVPGSTRSIGMRLRDRGVLSNWMDEAAIQKAITTPPQTTRAKIRAEFVNQNWDNEKAAVTWDRINIDASQHRAQVIGDPLQTTIDHSVHIKLR